MKSTIKDYLIMKYQPLGIVLHGSRAGGYATKHSDWDFFIFTNEEIPNKRKHVEEVVDGQFLDIMVWQFPILETDIKNYFAKYCGFAELIYDTDPLIKEFFHAAQQAHQEGKHLTPEELQLEKTNIEKEIERLDDWLDDKSGVFYLRVSDLFKKFYELWWTVKNNKFSMSPRKGLAILSETDPAYFNLLNVLCNASSNENQYQAIHKLRDSVLSKL